MSTDQLIEQVLDHATDISEVVDALHTLLDDRTVEPDRTYPIAEAASLTRQTPHTLRYYEREGIVQPGRTSTGHRSYTALDIRRLVFITRMRASGMPMRTLKEYIALVEHGPDTEPRRRDLMLAHRRDIVHRLRELQLALAATDYKIRTYNGHPGA